MTYQEYKKIKYALQSELYENRLACIECLNRKYAKFHGKKVKITRHLLKGTQEFVVFWDKFITTTYSDIDLRCYQVKQDGTPSKFRDQLWYNIVEDADNLDVQLVEE